MKLIVSKKGFTQPAIEDARFEGISTLSRFPEDRKEAGFWIGMAIYASVHQWSGVALEIHHAEPIPPLDVTSIYLVTWNGQPVINWFHRALATEHPFDPPVGKVVIELQFDVVRDLEIVGQTYPVSGLTFEAVRGKANKRLQVQLKGDGLYDWQNRQAQIPPGGRIVAEGVPTDFTQWEDYSGEIPETLDSLSLFMEFFLEESVPDSEVPDLTVL